MDVWQLVGGACLFLLLAYLAWHYLVYGNNEGIPQYPFVGCIPWVFENYENLFPVMAALHEKSKNMCLFGVMPGRTMLFTANPVHIQHMLKDNFENYPKGAHFYDLTLELLGDGIFSTDGEVWKVQRKIASYEFSTNSLRRMMLKSFYREISERLLPTLAAASAAGGEVDIQDVFLRYTMDSICKLGFGVELGALSPEFPDLPFTRCFDNVGKIISLRSSLPNFFWKSMRAFKLGFEGQLFKDMQVVNKFVAEVILKRRDDLAGKIKGSDGADPNALFGEDLDLLTRMIALGERDHGQLFSDSFLRDACLNFLLAGRDTSAVSLTCLFWKLSEYPEIEAKILEELQGIVRQRGGDSGAPFTFEELKKMTYMTAVINETLRLYPPVPADMKSVAGDDTWPDGTTVKKGWRITYNIYSVGRMTRVWGPDAVEFKPERWLTLDGEVKVESPFKFLAFNAGPRLCLGKEMAYLQIKSVAASVLLRYHLAVRPGFKPVAIPSITYIMQSGLPVSVRPRASTGSQNGA